MYFWAQGLFEIEEMALVIWMHSKSGAGELTILWKGAGNEWKNICQFILFSFLICWTCGGFSIAFFGTDSGGYPHFVR